MSTSTNHALALRAGRAAQLFEIWVKKLGKEARAQHSDFDPLTGHPGGKAVTLPVEMIVELIMAMARLKTEIRKFEAPKASN